MYDARPYQKAGARWIAETLRDRRCAALLDEPGLGKSRQALLASTILHARRILVVSPAGARRVWLAEIRRWYKDWLSRVVIIEPGNTPLVRDLEAPDAIALCSYDAFSMQNSPWVEHIKRLAWDLLIIDEAHYLKSWSKRTLAIYGDRGDNNGVQASAERVILLSATLAPNHCGELYQHLRTFWPATLRSNRYPDAPMPEEAYIEYVCRYRDSSRFGRHIVGSQNVDWLRERLRPYVLKRTKRQVLPELPAMVEQDIPVAMSATAVRARLSPETRSLERQLHNMSEAKLWETLKAVPVSEDASTLPLATLRHELGMMKVQPTMEWVLERLSCGVSKIVVFGWHTKALDALTALLRPEFGAVLVTGKTPPVTRAKLIAQFQTDPACRVFVGQIIAAGTAITLTAASEVAMMECSWVPGENRQAADRLHRLGQHQNVVCTFLYLPDTLDQRILRVMRRKSAETMNLIPGAVADA